ncbi:MAG: galactose mutarotase, partial [Firmicutes bacterium]|nr:galactose mutarotase [Bacillota bacterium]
QLKGGSAVKKYTITNAGGSSIAVLDLGAVLQSAVFPDKDGKMLDVTLGYDYLAPYEAGLNCFGGTVGRHANRIKNGTFEINGVQYQLYRNNGINNLHSGPNGFHIRMFEAEIVGENAVKFTIESPDGDQGFPGSAVCSVTYTLTDDNAIELSYDCESDKDTIMNMTNHAYWNLDGHDQGTIEKHCLKLNAVNYTPLLPNQTPSGEIVPVEGTPFDFREFKEIGRDLHEENEQLTIGSGYDHNFMIDGEGMRVHAVLKGAKSGITMTVCSDLPAISSIPATALPRRFRARAACSM